MKKKVLKIIIIIILVILVLFIINTVRNFNIINNIFEKQAKLKECNNYSYIREDYSVNENDEKAIMEVYKKDEKNIMINKTNGNNVMVWNNIETKELIFVDLNKLEATVTTSDNGLIGTEVPVSGEISFGEKLFVSVSSFITNDELNEEKCYCIRQIGSSTTYVSAESGIPLKTIGASKSVIDGKEYDSITEIKEWKTNQLSDKDVARPNLIGYKIQNEK